MNGSAGEPDCGPRKLWSWGPRRVRCWWVEPTSPTKTFKRLAAPTLATSHSARLQGGGRRDYGRSRHSPSDRERLGSEGDELMSCRQTSSRRRHVIHPSAACLPSTPRRSCGSRICNFGRASLSRASSTACIAVPFMDSPPSSASIASTRPAMIHATSTGDCTPAATVTTSSGSKTRRIVAAICWSISAARWATARETTRKADYARTLAATLAYYLTLQRDCVGLLTYDEQVREFLPARYRIGHLRSLMSLLEQAEQGSSTNMVAALEQVASLVKKRGLVVILSDFSDAGRRRCGALCPICGREATK